MVIEKKWYLTICGWNAVVVDVSENGAIGWIVENGENPYALIPALFITGV